MERKKERTEEKERKKKRNTEKYIRNVLNSTFKIKFS